MATDLSNVQAPRHSLTEIKTAVEALMSRLSQGRSHDSSLAERIASNIHSAVNDPRNALDNLNGNPAFERMVTEQAPKLAEAVNDPATKLAAARSQEARTNVSGAPLSDSALALLGIRRMTHGRTNDGDREGRASGARFDGIGSPTDYNSQAGQAFMRSYAMEKGVTWAANNSDILRLGPAGIDILAQTKLREETFNRLTDAGLSSKGSVGVAAMIHAQGGDANEGGKAVADSLKAMGDKAVTDAVNARATLQVPDKNETLQKKQAREAKISEADARVESAVGEHTKHHPEHAGHGKKLMKTLGVKLKENDAQAKVTATQIKTDDAKINANKAGFAALNGTGLTSPSKPETSTPQRQPATAPKP